MIALATILIAAGIALILWRRSVAHWQGMLLGGRMPVAFAVVEGLALIAFAILALVMLREG